MHLESVGPTCAAWNNIIQYCDVSMTCNKQTNLTVSHKLTPVNVELWLHGINKYNMDAFIGQNSNENASTLPEYDWSLYININLIMDLISHIFTGTKRVLCKCDDLHIQG